MKTVHEIRDFVLFLSLEAVGIVLTKIANMAVQRYNRR